jgi:hypothetical protein
MCQAVFVVAVLATLAACTATMRPQPTKVETSGVSVALGGGGPPKTFCPPGQAKKGRG